MAEDALTIGNGSIVGQISGDVADARVVLQQSVRRGAAGDTVVFLPLGELHLRQSFANDTLTFYNRQLDLESAVVSTDFITGDGAVWSRTCFASYPAREMVVRITTSKAGTLNFALDGEMPWPGARVEAVSDREFVVSGFPGRNMTTQGGYPFRWNGEMECGYRVRVLDCDGLCYTAPGLRVRDASYALLGVSLLGEAPADSTASKGFEELYKEHDADYSALFECVKLDLPTEDSSLDAMTTDSRISRYAAGEKDPGLEMLGFNLQRYLRIAGFRDWGVPVVGDASVSYAGLRDMIGSTPVASANNALREVAGMLLQSRGGEMSILPALPGEWREGSVKGLVASGGFLVDITWKAGALDRAVITCGAQPCVIRTSGPVVVVRSGRGRAVSSHMEKQGDSYVTGVTTKAGDKLLVVAN